MIPTDGLTFSRKGTDHMNRITLLLSATTIALAPLMSNAKPQIPESDFDEIVMGECNCNAPYDVMVDDGFGNMVPGKQFDCGVSWPDVISDSEESATYGASFDVEVTPAEGEEAQSLDADMDLDWSVVCDGTACTVAPGAAPFVLTNLGDTDEVLVEAAVKAFKTGRNGKAPRNFLKSRVQCTIAVEDATTPVE
jgi:hypothetical protein